MKKIFPLFLLVLLLASCQKDPDMSKLSDDFVVFTDYDKDAKFDSFNTFYVPDSIMLIGSSKEPEFWTAADAGNIITKLAGSMEGRGYTRSMDKADAQLGLQVSFIKNVNYFTDYGDNSYWWWGYPGYNWWYNYWGNWNGSWNGWDYPYTVVYSYSVGSLLVELVNLKTPLPKSVDAKLPVLWTAYMTGLLSGSDKVNVELSTRAIEQAFVQSPYIKK